MFTFKPLFCSLFEISDRLQCSHFAFYFSLLSWDTWAAPRLGKREQNLSSTNCIHNNFPSGGLFGTALDDLLFSSLPPKTEFKTLMKTYYTGRTLILMNQLVCACVIFKPSTSTTRSGRPLHTALHNAWEQLVLHFSYMEKYNLSNYVQRGKL